MKIRDFVLNEIISVPLVVKSAVARETKAKKPYLALELFDGVETINGNYWDWAGKNIPAANAILNVNAQVTEWQGVKQLNIKGLTTNNELTLSHFAPKPIVDIAEVYSNAYALMSDVGDNFLRNLALSVLEELQDRWLTVPGAKGVHHAYTAGTLVHSYSVACIAKSIAKSIKPANKDLCVVGAMLHDLGKLFTYQLNGVTVDMTDEGMLFDHIFMGAEFIGNFVDNHCGPSGLNSVDSCKLEMLRHIILSHHGRLEHGAVVTPMSLEAHIVHHADAIDAAAEQIREQSAKLGNVKWTDRIWTLDNRPHLTTQYVTEVMKFDMVLEN